MTGQPPGRSETWERGGTIPGTAGDSAFVARADPASPIPVLIAVPHAGRNYPPALVAAMRDPGEASARLEDRLVDALGEAVAAATGASLIVARAPRAMIDLNRAPEDVDWEMVSGGSPPPSGAPPAGRRARSGLGLVPRRLPGVGEVWRARLTGDELDRRIAGVHAPYHEHLAAQLAALRARWGAALLIDLHSMPPLDRSRGGDGAEYVIGDRFGATCDGGLIGTAFAALAAAGCSAAHNRPYAGGYTLERHAARRRGVHALQVEVDRRSYLDSPLRERGPGFEHTAGVLTAFVRRLAGEVALLGSGSARWPLAAE